jgi:hypothetical protein
VRWVPVEKAPNLEVELQPDDRILLYADGITEVFNRQGEMLGISGVQEIVRKSSCQPGARRTGINGVAMQNLGSICCLPIRKRRGWTEWRDNRRLGI